MASDRLTNSMKYQLVLWTPEGYGYTDIQRRSRMRYQKAAPAHFINCWWYNEYQTRRGHSHKGGNCRPQICNKNEYWTRAMSNENLNFSLRNSSARSGVHHTKIWHFPRRELKLFQYRLQMHQQITDSDELNRTFFAQHFRNDLKHDSEFLRWIVFPISANFLFLEMGTKKIVGFRVQRVHNKYTKRFMTPALLLLGALCHKTK